MNKKLQLLFCMLSISLQASAQESFYIGGTLPPAAEKTVELQFDKNHLGKRIVSQKTEISNGSFQFKIVSNKSQIVQLLNPEFRLPLYVNPGDSLVLNYQSNPVVSIQLSGKGSLENNFLQQFTKKFSDDFNDSLSDASSLAMTIDAFEEKIFSNRKAQIDFLKGFTGYNEFNPRFKVFVEDMITYRYWKELLAFPIVNANKSTTILKVNPIPEIMLENFAKVKVDNSSSLIIDTYRDFLKYYVIYETSKANGFNKFTDYSISAERKTSVAREKLSGEVLAYWMSKFLIDECEHVSPYMSKKIFLSLQEFDKDKSYQQIVLDVCGARINDRSSTEKPADKAQEKSSGGAFSDLDLTTIDGKPFSLSSLKGKVVYIDYWASWCGPCRGMMPFSKQLHDNLSEKEKKSIVFLYVSIDADKEAWKKAITDMGMEGTMVISPGNWSSNVCKFFQIGSIPRYMIMNKKGEIVDFNAKRPMDPALLDQLREQMGIN